jgi:hypothetical protein
MTVTLRHNPKAGRGIHAGAAKAMSLLSAELLARAPAWYVAEPAGSAAVDPGDIGTVQFGAEGSTSEAEEVSEELEEVQMPPVVDALVLRDYLGKQASVFSHVLPDGSPLAGMGGYTWYSEDNFNKAHRWCLGLIAADEAGMPIEFFVDAIVDLYHFDRALRASAHSRRRKPPVRRTNVPNSMTIRNPSGSYDYRLVPRPFAWSSMVPHHAVDSVAEFLQAITPDSLWIAEYVYTPSKTKYDPIIYATFGPWEVEVAQWG